MIWIIEIEYWYPRTKVFGYTLLSQDPLLHVIWDASAIAPALTPKVSDRNEVSALASSLLRSVVDFNWPGMCFYIPKFCLIETKCLLDKQRLCTWHGSVKRDPQRQLTQAEFDNASKQLIELTRSRTVQQIEQPADATDLLRLVSVLNYKYRYRRRTKERKPDLKPMGSADVLLATVAIDLATKVGSKNVLVITCDKRLADVLKLGSTIASRKAESIGLKAVAKELLGRWDPSIYPPALYLPKASTDDLATVFGDWPLPTRALSSKSRGQLTEPCSRALYKLGKQIKDETGVGPDSLPYTPELRRIQVMFARETGIFMTQGDIARQLLNWRKNPDKAPVPNGSVAK